MSSSSSSSSSVGLSAPGAAFTAALMASSDSLPDLNCSLTHPRKLLRRTSISPSSYWDNSQHAADTQAKGVGWVVRRAGDAKQANKQTSKQARVGEGGGGDLEQFYAFAHFAQCAYRIVTVENGEACWRGACADAIDQLHLAMGSLL